MIRLVHYRLYIKIINSLKLRKFLSWKKEKKFFSTIFGLKKQMNILDTLFNPFSVCRKIRLPPLLAVAEQVPVIVEVDVMDHALLRVRAVVNEMKGNNLIISL